MKKTANFYTTFTHTTGHAICAFLTDKVLFSLTYDFKTCNN